ncbi:MAG: PqiC family protein [Rhodanobacter sp.]
MICHPLRALALLGVLGLTACTSAPLHYYTLVAPQADSGAQAGAASAPDLSFELLPVSVPAQVDQPQLVVRSGAQGMQLLNGERWIAPLADELRSALAANLTHALPARDASGLPADGRPRLRIKFDVRRFDSQPGQYALLAGTWSVRPVQGARAGQVETTLTCADSVRESVGPGYPALVEGHQRALARVAAHIAAAARAVVAGQTAACPTR